MTGYLLRPKGLGPFPVIIFNRGGHESFQELTDAVLVHGLARMASWGYVVAASQYRGADGGEGHDEFGGRDVDDVMNLLRVLDHEQHADTSRLGIFGWSRGGLMTYLVLARTDRFRATVVGGGISDAFAWVDARPEMETIFRGIIPGFDKDRTSALEARSPVRWADKICPNTLILILHGSADWRVEPRQSVEMAAQLIRLRHPVRLTVFEGGDHAIHEHTDEVDLLIRRWFDRYVRDGEPLPRMEPHGE